jgi:hypothetical protein
LTPLEASVVHTFMFAFNPSRSDLLVSSYSPYASISCPFQRLTSLKTMLAVDVQLLNSSSNSMSQFYGKERRQEMKQERTLKNASSSCDWSPPSYEGEYKTSVGKAARILNHGTRWRWVVNLTLRPLYTRSSIRLDLPYSEISRMLCQKWGLNWKLRVKIKMAVFCVVEQCSLKNALMMEAASTSETSVNLYQTTRCNNPADSHLHTRRRENLKSHKSKNVWRKTFETNKGEVKRLASLLPT